MKNSVKMILVASLLLMASSCHHSPQGRKVRSTGLPQNIKQAALATLDGKCDAGRFTKIYSQGSSTMTKWRAAEPHNSARLSAVPGGAAVYALFALGSCTQRFQASSQDVVFHAGRVVLGPNGELFLLELRETRTSLPAPPAFSRALDVGGEPPPSSA